MSNELGEAIRSLVNERGISEDLVLETIKGFLLAAYKRKFGTADNAVVQFNETNDDVQLFARKMIVEDDDFDGDITEIPHSEAMELHEDCEVGDEILIPIDPKTFDRISVQSAKQKARQDLKDIQKDTLYSEFKTKENEMIIGYYQREQNGDIYVDLGKVEGILPKRYQSPREAYRKNDKIKCFVYQVEKPEHGQLRVILSRTHSEFVKKLFELEIPEIYDHSIEIFKIVREPGFRTKVAVYTRREDLDPVGACVGLKGIRIQTIMREMEGERIDVLRYDTNPIEFIKNALAPAEVKKVVILDEVKRTAIAVVDETQLSLAIGKQGLNVRLANKLVDWVIDVKTVDQFREMDLGATVKERVDALFAQEPTIEQEFDEDEMLLSQIPELGSALIEKLNFHDIYTVEEFVNLTQEELAEFDDITDEDVLRIHEILEDYVDIVEEEVDEQQEYEFQCPECGHPISTDMTVCPNCHVGLSFEEVELDEE
ncbi:MAG: transcription termination factor NusA [Sphaerochaetaceae bacterium]|mgnify:FL=1|jgi:N utilization substance protein A|nr:transcription termination factor NusA [Sphaerochaetaceae bacterium]MDD4260113.1 transcription termination factor NusA [Sphaerochaetaceae bacterium]MDD4840959.1 transcription termination factor NusA [Sphaerochaetaceae bacterium]MDD5075584.1 transcription termination factor NusA [Sphaerochaetaceae bacterium]MDX9935056.1 transcription termination factor NusA [Sphaerochaetaceae bacterium]